MTENVKAIRAQLADHARHASGQLDVFFGSNDPDMDAQLDALVNYLVRSLLGRDRKLAQDAAHRIRAVVPAPEPWWWRTDLGRAVAWVDGYGADVVPRTHAASILGVSRQRIGQLEIAGALESTPAGIVNDSLLKRLHAPKP